MNRKKILIEKLKDRVLSSLNENIGVEPGLDFDPFIGSSKNTPVPNSFYNPIINVKSGEKWFDFPFNSCLKTLMLKQQYKSDFRLDGHTFCYHQKGSNNKGCFEARFSKDEKGNWNGFPGRINRNEIGSDVHAMYGDWWCEPGRYEPIVDWLPKTKAHRDRIYNKDKSPRLSDEEYQKFIEKELGKQTSSNITQAKTMEDVKNGVGYIKKGMTGPVVKLLQKMLLKLDYDLGPQKDDGIFGEKTEDAVEKFQKDFNIKPKNNIYGIFGSITLNKMIEKLKEAK